MILYRFGSDALRPADEEFNGQGGLRAPGRWSLVGRPCVYASTCEPLALLEKLVHFAGLRRPAYSLYIADVPDNLIEDLPAASLPPDWRSIYPPASTRQLGSKWLASKSAAGLLLPSVLISGADPTIKKCLLNPEHPGYAHAKFSGPIPLAIDPRF